MIVNDPKIWRDTLPKKTGDAHKYDHGYALVYAAPDLTGATRLAASACARMGAGLVTVVSDKATAAIYKQSLPPHIMVRDDVNWFDDRVTVCLYGPGGMVADVDYTRDACFVLDADALVNLPARFTQNTVLTPHEGEFSRCFPHIKGSREDRASSAAKQSGAYIILKGEKSVIAAPDGRIVINDHACADLATAGAGDVLSGMVAGLCARNMPVFEALCAAVWMHGDCALRFGAGLVASDLLDIIPVVYQGLISD